MITINDLTKNAVRLYDDVWIVKSKKKESALNASTQVFDGGLTIVVKYRGTNYVKMTDGQLTFSQLRKIGEGGDGSGIQTINGKSGTSVTLGSTDINTQYIIGGETQTGTIQQGMTAYGNQIDGIWADLNALPPVASTGSYDDLIDKPTLGTAAAADTTDFATAAQGALADTAVQPEDLTWDNINDKPTEFRPIAHSHDASAITTGTIVDARIPNLNASKINAGTFADARIPNLAISKITGLQAELNSKVESVQEQGVGTVITNIIALTQAQYDGLSTINPSTYYIIVE